MEVSKDLAPNMEVRGTKNNPEIVQKNNPNFYKLFIINLYQILRQQTS